MKPSTCKTSVVTECSCFIMRGTMLFTYLINFFWLNIKITKDGYYYITKVRLLIRAHLVIFDSGRGI